MLLHASVVVAAMGFLTGCVQYRDSQVLGTWQVPYEAGVAARMTFKADHTFDFHYKKGRIVDRVSGPWYIRGDRLWTRFPRIGWNDDQIRGVRADEIDLLEGGDNYVTYTRIR